MTEAPNLARRPADGSGLSDTFHQWWRDRLQANKFEVDRVPFTELDGWGFDPATGNLGHRSGRFFTIEGLRLQGSGPANGRIDSPLDIRSDGR